MVVALLVILFWQFNDGVAPHQKKNGCLNVIKLYHGLQVQEQVVHYVVMAVVVLHCQGGRTEEPLVV